jgi:hypothetical protein
MERAVIKAICDKHPDDRTSIEAQLATAMVISRENTSAGFYTNFDVQRSPNVAIGDARERDLRHGPQAAIKGITYGMGFILWLNQGYLDCLEGYTYDDDTTALDLANLQFEIVHIYAPEEPHRHRP